MDPITLRIAGMDAPGFPLGPGVHGMARADDGSIAPVADAQNASMCYCVDRRGVWLTVGAGMGGVHVNGRPIRRMAMLRVGDTVHADGAEMILLGSQAPAPPADALATSGQRHHDPRIVLRGVGGHHHGRSFTLDRPRLVGSDRSCDIRIDTPGFPDRHCRFELQDGVLVLRDLGSEDGSFVNGRPVRDAVLKGGDQVVFDANQRFVVEAPAGETRPAIGLPVPDPTNADGPATSQRALGRGARRLPWLLLAALLIAAMLSALLLFGTTG